MPPSRRLSRLRWLIMVGCCRSRRSTGPSSVTQPNHPALEPHEATVPGVIRPPLPHVRPCDPDRSPHSPVRLCTARSPEKQETI
ncbi:hypothetical protein C8Q74DRAFT_217729 [Fomes fomentarius]|nr:hypothetical protein C8Q74DRAFT_217729 [Fomes fomentarius]